MNIVIFRSKKFAILAVAAIALVACGGSSVNSNTASDVALGVKGVAPLNTSTSPAVTTVAATCAAGGACVVGDAGPGGSKVFYVAPTSFTSTGSACGTACKYLEVAPIGWITAATPAGQTNNCVTPGTSTADPKCAWSGNTKTSIGTSYAIGAGYANTSAMIAQSNVAGKAATVARAFQGGGKTDWYLPSKDELNQMYLQRFLIGGISTNYFGTSEEYEDNWYWSSSEFAADGAWSQYFFNGQVGTDRKKYGFDHVRPVRAF